MIGRQRTSKDNVPDVDEFHRGVHAPARRHRRRDRVRTRAEITSLALTPEQYSNYSEANSEHSSRLLSHHRRPSRDTETDTEVRVVDNSPIVIQDVADDSIEFCDGLLTTASVSGTTQYKKQASFGNVFDVQTKSNVIHVNGFDFRTNALTEITFELYTKSGSFSLGTSLIEEWTLLKQGTVKGRGSDRNTPIRNFRQSTTVQANAIQSFYITLTTPDLLYETDSDSKTGVGDVYIENENLDIRLGIALNGRDSSIMSNGVEFETPRLWSGSLYYTAEGVCPTFRSAIDVQATTTPTVSLAPSLTPSTSVEPSFSPSSGPSNLPSVSHTPSLSSTPSLIPSSSQMPTLTGVPSSLPSIVPSLSLQPSISTGLSSLPTSSPRPSAGPSIPPSSEGAPSGISVYPSSWPSSSPSSSAIPTSTGIPSSVPSVSFEPSGSVEPSSLPSSSSIPTATGVPSDAASGVPSKLFDSSVSPVPSSLPSSSPIPTSTGVPSSLPSISFGPSVSAVPSFLSSSSSMPSSTGIPSDVPSIIFESSVSPGPSSLPSKSAIPTSTGIPSSVPSVSFEPSGSVEPSSLPSSSSIPTATGVPSDATSGVPSKSFDPSVSAVPSSLPSSSPIPTSTGVPSSLPSISVGPSLSMVPSSVPSDDSISTVTPTISPTTQYPTQSMTVSPITPATEAPAVTPAPSLPSIPTGEPTTSPTTTLCTIFPTFCPPSSTTVPTPYPTIVVVSPSPQPSIILTGEPTKNPVEPETNPLCLIFPSLSVCTELTTKIPTPSPTVVLLPTPSPSMIQPTPPTSAPPINPTVCLIFPALCPKGPTGILSLSPSITITALQSATPSILVPLSKSPSIVPTLTDTATSMSPTSSFPSVAPSIPDLLVPSASTNPTSTHIPTENLSVSPPPTISMPPSLEASTSPPSSDGSTVAPSVSFKPSTSLIASSIPTFTPGPTSDLCEVCQDFEICFSDRGCANRNITTLDWSAPFDLCNEGAQLCDPCYPDKACAASAPSAAPSTIEADGGETDYPTLSPTDNVISTETSRTCRTFTEKPESNSEISQKFTYIVQSNQTSVSFVQLTESIILEKVADSLLKCPERISRKSIRLLQNNDDEEVILRVYYSGNKPISLIKACNPTDDRMISCWNIESQLFLTTLPLFSEEAGNRLEFAIRGIIEKDVSFENAIPGLSSVVYLTPESESRSNNDSNLTTIFAASAAGIAGVIMLIGIILFRRQRKRTSKLPFLANAYSVGSIHSDNEPEFSSTHYKVEAAPLVYSKYDDRSASTYEKVPMKQSTTEDRSDDDASDDYTFDESHVESNHNSIAEDSHVSRSGTVVTNADIYALSDTGDDQRELPIAKEDNTMLQIDGSKIAGHIQFVDADEGISLITEAELYCGASEQPTASINLQHHEDRLRQLQPDSDAYDTMMSALLEEGIVLVGSPSESSKTAEFSDWVQNDCLSSLVEGKENTVAILPSPYIEEPALSADGQDSESGRFSDWVYDTSAKHLEGDDQKVDAVESNVSAEGSIPREHAHNGSHDASHELGTTLLNHRGSELSNTNESLGRSGHETGDSADETERTGGHAISSSHSSDFVNEERSALDQMEALPDSSRESNEYERERSIMSGQVEGESLDEDRSEPTLSLQSNRSNVVGSSDRLGSGEQASLRSLIGTSDQGDRSEPLSSSQLDVGDASNRSDQYGSGGELSSHISDGSSEVSRTQSILSDRIDPSQDETFQSHVETDTRGSSAPSFFSEVSRPLHTDQHDTYDGLDSTSVSVSIESVRDEVLSSKIEEQVGINSYEEESSLRQDASIPSVESGKSNTSKKESLRQQQEQFNAISHESVDSHIADDTRGEGLKGEESRSGGFGCTDDVAPRGDDKPSDSHENSSFSRSLEEQQSQYSSIYYEET